MHPISLQTDYNTDFTLVSNIFIDQYMPTANGAYVKVYLYLLRCFNDKHSILTVSSIADRLDNTENDIIRALNYWEKLNLLSLSYNENHELTEIRMTDLNITQYSSTSVDLTRSTMEEVAIAHAPAIPSGIKPTPRTSYSPERIAELTNNDSIQWAMHIVEIYLDRPLKPMDIQLILYLHEGLHFSAELIMYLYEYCVSKGKKSASYIEAVALTWAEEGIDTEAKAKEATATYNDHFNVVNKAFGLNRAPGQVERQYIQKWVEVFGYPDDIIVEACNRTLLRTQKPDFNYTDKILETWFKKGVKNKEDIARLDEEFLKGGNRSYQNTSKSVNSVKSTSNKFNQYPQRTYTTNDYAEMERKLINKGL